MVGEELDVVLPGHGGEPVRLGHAGLGRQSEGVGGRAEVFEEALEGAARPGGYTDDLTVVAFHAVGVPAVLGHEAEVARGEQLLLLGPFGVLDEQPDRALGDVEDLVGVGVQVGWDEVALGPFDGEEVEGVLGLLAAGCRW